MIYSNILKQAILITGIVCISLLSACTLAPSRYYETQRGKLTIIQSQHIPTIIAPYGVSSTAEGTLGGVGKGMGACLGGGAQTGEAMGLVIGIILMPVCGLVGGIHGAATAEREKTAKQEGNRMIDWVSGEQIQHYFIQAVIDYTKQQDVPHTIIEPTTDKVLVKGDQHALEIKVDHLEIKRLKKGKDPDNDIICLLFTFSGETMKIDQQIPLKFRSGVGCRMTKDWREEGQARLQKQIEKVLSRVAERIINEQYLIYHPSVDKDHPAYKKRLSVTTDNVPDYVLAAIKPRMSAISEETYTKLYKTGQVHPDTQLSIPEIKESKPHLAWEAFPMPWDSAMTSRRQVDDVRYEVRIYQAEFRERKRFMSLSKYYVKELVYKRENLQETEHHVETTLEPCKSYVWTVRALFKLEGSPRITEWGGTYNHFPGYRSLGHSLHYMFRVNPGEDECA